MKEFIESKKKKKRRRKKRKRERRDRKEFLFYSIRALKLAKIIKGYL